jgi:hypothetical protein
LPENYEYSSARFYELNDKRWDFLSHFDDWFESEKLPVKNTGNGRGVEIVIPKNENIDSKITILHLCFSGSR